MILLIEKEQRRKISTCLIYRYILDVLLPFSLPLSIYINIFLIIIYLYSKIRLCVCVCVCDKKKVTTQHRIKRQFKYNSST